MGARGGPEGVQRAARAVPLITIRFGRRMYLQLNERAILKTPHMGEVVQLMQSYASHLYDRDMLMKVRQMSGGVSRAGCLRS
eukprot:9382461-Pyramimonas_sp.AAC.1